MTAALEGGYWSAARPGRTLPPGKTRFYRRLGGSQGRSGRAEYLVPTGIRSRIAQPVAQSLYRLSYPAHKRCTVHVLKYKILIICSFSCASLLLGKWILAVRSDTACFPNIQNKSESGRVNFPTRLTSNTEDGGSMFSGKVGTNMSVCLSAYTLV